MKLFVTIFQLSFFLISCGHFTYAGAVDCSSLFTPEYTAGGKGGRDKDQGESVEIRIFDITPVKEEPATRENLDTARVPQIRAALKGADALEIRELLQNMMLETADQGTGVNPEKLGGILRQRCVECQTLTLLN